MHGFVKYIFSKLTVATTTPDTPANVQRSVHSIKGDSSTLGEMPDTFHSAGITEITRSVNSVPMPLLRPARSRQAASAKLLNLKNVPCTRLPKAPLTWEERQQVQYKSVAEDKACAEMCSNNIRASRKDPPRFVVSGDSWILAKEDVLLPNERPDLTFTQMFPTPGTTLWLNPKGRGAGYPSAAAIAQTTHKNGTRLAKSDLMHDVYRVSMNADGSGILFLSRDGRLYGYSNTLDPLLYESIVDLPEYIAQAERFEIQPHEIKSHIRCMALSTDHSRYLVTVVDEAWCYDVKSGDPLWGIRFPTQDGWAKFVAKRSDRMGTSAEVDAALRLMELALPVSPEAITRQYRVLAMRWHPDRNPQNSDATHQFQELMKAMEVLTGADLSQLTAQEIEKVTYQKILHQSRITLSGGGKVAISAFMGGTKFAADWIYAASFSRSIYSSFLAGYSGKIVELDATGHPLRVYDIGAVPRQVIDTQSHLYILTDTRLYVLCEDQLEAFVDVFDQGKIIVGDTGFGLLQSKTFQWFTPTGRLLGQIQTRNPIRRIYSGNETLIVETRQHRCTIRGASSW